MCERSTHCGTVAFILLASAPISCAFNLHGVSAAATPRTSARPSHARAGSAVATISLITAETVRCLPQRVPVRGTERKYEQAYVGHYCRVLQRAIRMEQRKIRRVHEDEARAITAVATLRRVLDDTHTKAHAGLRRRYMHTLRQHENVLGACRAEREKHVRLLDLLLEQQRAVLRKRYVKQFGHLFAEPDELAVVRRQTAFDLFD